MKYIKLLILTALMILGSASVAAHSTYWYDDTHHSHYQTYNVGQYTHQCPYYGCNYYQHKPQYIVITNSGGYSYGGYHYGKFGIYGYADHHNRYNYRGYHSRNYRPSSRGHAYHRQVVSGNGWNRYY